MFLFSLNLTLFNRHHYKNHALYVPQFWRQLMLIFCTNATSAFVFANFSKSVAVFYHIFSFLYRNNEVLRISLLPKTPSECCACIAKVLRILVMPKNRLRLRRGAAPIIIARVKRNSSDGSLSVLFLLKLRFLVTLLQQPFQFLLHKHSCHHFLC